MNTIVKAAGSNMSGNQQRPVKAAVRDLLTELCEESDAESGELINANLSTVIADIRASWVKNTARAPKLFSSASTYALGAVKGKKTKQCFTGKFWGYRDSDFDGWLPADQSDAGAGSITVLTPEKGWTFAEAAVSVLNVSPETPQLALAKLLIERGHTMPLTRLEELAEATERGEKTGLVTNGWGNFAFTETGNEDNPVSVAGVRRRDDVRPWDADVGGLSDGFRWDADDRLMVCNLDPSKLGL